MQIESNNKTIRIISALKYRIDIVFSNKIIKNYLTNS